jgi:hypothetical protein
VEAGLRMCRLMSEKPREIRYLNSVQGILLAALLGCGIWTLLGVALLL